MYTRCMSLCIEPRAAPELAIPLHHLLKPHSENGALYALTDGDSVVWQVSIAWRWPSLPFRGQLVWPAAGVVAIGGGDEVVFLDLETAHLRRHLDVSGYFGYLTHDPGEPGGRDESLLVLGCSDVLAFAPSLELRWGTYNIAVDGVTGGEIDGQVVRVGAEMDPPGGWFDVELDAKTGAELSRRPDFSPGYTGIYANVPRTE